jgi:hypothetical protein
MLHNGPFTRKGAVDVADPVTHDPACVDWSLFGRSKGDWKSNKRGQDPVVPRIETHSFDPYTQARPDLYSFQRQSKSALLYYSQTRRDGKFLGTVETTALGNPRESVLRIFWKKNGGADLEFEMVGSVAFKTYNGKDVDVPPICSGYCKLTDLGAPVPNMIGKLGWVVVVNKLHGESIRRSQDVNLLSLPLFEAVATAVAFGIYGEDRKVRDLYPVLGTMSSAGVGEPAAIGAMAESVHGQGTEQWLRIDAADFNRQVNVSTKLRTVPLADIEPGKGVELTPVSAEDHVGAVFPLKKNNNALADGLTIDRLIVGEKCVTYKDYPDATGICKFIVQGYSKLHANGEQSVFTLDIAPLAYADSNGRLTLQSHIAKPMVGTQWVTPGRGQVTVTDQEVELATTEIAAWDQKLTACIEKAMYAVRTGSELGVARFA